MYSGVLAAGIGKGRVKSHVCLYTAAYVTHIWLAKGPVRVRKHCVYGLGFRISDDGERSQCPCRVCYEQAWGLARQSHIGEI